MLDQMFGSSSPAWVCSLCSHSALSLLLYLCLPSGAPCRSAEGSHYFLLCPLKPELFQIKPYPRHASALEGSWPCPSSWCSALGPNMQQHRGSGASVAPCVTCSCRIDFHQTLMKGPRPCICCLQSQVRTKGLREMPLTPSQLSPLAVA